MKYTTMKFKTIIFLVLVICALFLPSTSAENPYWNTSFSTREPITITTTGTSSPANYQVKLNISYESEMQTDFDDIRFTNSSNGEIAYWIESKVDSNYANVWVNLSDGIADPVSDTIWMYYGNNVVSEGSNGVDTFLQYQGSTSIDFKLANVAGSSNMKMRVRYTKGNNTVEYLGTSNSAGWGDDDSIYNGLNPGYIAACTCFNEGSFTQEAAAGSGATTNTYDFLLDVGTNLKFYRDDVLLKTFTTNLPNEDMGMKLQDIGTTGEWIWGFLAKYIVNEPTPSYGVAQHYTDSLHYNASLAYNFTIESDGTITSNRSTISADDTNDTVQSTGISYLQINVYNNSATIVRTFTFSGDNLDWYQVANISGSYNLKNSGGIIETQSNGKFTTNLVAGTYWIKESFFSITSIYSLTYSDEAYVMWTTDIPSSNIVEYSLYSDMSSSSWSTWNNATTDPVILITELTRDTTYYYEVSSTQAGDTITSATLNFSTQNNTHGFSKYFDRAFVVNDIDGWSVGQSMFGAYADSVGEYIVWTLILGSVFLVMTIRMESVVVPVVLSLISAAFLFPLLPPEHDIPAKVILGLSITGILWHLFIGRR